MTVFIDFFVILPFLLLHGMDAFMGFLLCHDVILGFLVKFHR